jgi:hypothetical protein
LYVLVLCLAALLAGSSSAARADTSTQLPFSASAQGQPAWIVVDPVGQHVFVSAGGESSVVVLDYDGTIVKTISVPDGASGMALDASTHTLYTASGGFGTNTMSEIDTTTLTVTGTFPTFYDVSSVAIAGGKLWFSGRPSYGAAVDVGSENLDGGNLTAQGLGRAYQVATGGTSGQLLGVARQEADYRPGLAVYDVSGGSPALVSSLLDIGSETSSVPELGFDPSGDHLLVPALGTNAVNSYVTSTLAASLQYATDTPPVAVATTADGAYLAAGGAGAAGTSNLLVFRAGDATRWHRWSVGPVAQHALAFSPDSSRLFAVTASGGFLDFTVLTDPTQLQAATTTSLTTSAPAVRFGQSATLSVQVTGTTTGTVDLSATVNGATTVVGSQPIDGSGAASFTVTPSQNTTYSATLEAGTGYLSSTSSTVSVGVAPTIVVKAHAQRTTVRQFLRHGEKVIIVITIKPGAALGSPCKLQVQWSLNKRRWRTVAGGSFMAIDGPGYVRFKTKLPGFYRAQVRFPGNPSFLHASSQWAKFQAPTVLR